MSNVRAADRRSWLRPAAAMFVVGWGANMFAPLLDVYRQALTSVEVTGLFGAYVLGLIPAVILVAPLSDRWGRGGVLRPVVILSGLASVVLLLAGNSFTALLIGRIVVGVAAGAAFGPGTVWVKELSDKAGSTGAGARRAAMALTGGFAAGPFFSGVLSQWLPFPEVLPYIVHIVLVIATSVYIWAAPETAGRLGAERDRAPRKPLELGTALRSRLFLAVVLPTAPWVFAAATAALAALPSQIDVGHYDEIASGVASGITLGTGVLVQPWARRLAQSSQRAPYLFGVSALVAGMLVGAVTALTHLAAILIPAAIFLGAAYGLLLVSGLSTIEKIARPTQLATLTGIYYSLTYLGFAFPLLDSILTPSISSPGFFVVAAVLGAMTFLGLAFGWKKQPRTRTPALSSDAD
jgi:MFS family permease